MISPDLVKKFLVRILNDNFFEFKVREDACRLLENDYVDVLNYKVIKEEVKDINLDDFIEKRNIQCYKLRSM
jgi:hypothetical protein